MTEKYQSEYKLRVEVDDERRDLLEKYERQREMMKENAKELIETQSQVADFEERIMITEQQLISAKACWANSEHEREQMHGQN